MSGLAHMLLNFGALVSGKIAAMAIDDKESPVSDEKSGPAAAVSGVVEGVKGKAKEVIGAVTGKDELRREGEAQGEKAGALRDVAVGGWSPSWRSSISVRVK